MTDIGLPLARPSGVDLAGLGRSAARAIAPPALLALLLLGGWELLEPQRRAERRACCRRPARCSTRWCARSAVLMEQAQPTFWGAVAGIVLAAGARHRAGRAPSPTRAR